LAVDNKPRIPRGLLRIDLQQNQQDRFLLCWQSAESYGTKLAEQMALNTLE